MKRAVFCAALLSGLNASAQVLNDPTRPPAGLEAETPGAAARGPVLQSVKISQTERSAIIGGETVKLGAKYGDARVVKITENEVVLRSANGTETLHMYPGVRISPIAAAPAAADTPTPPKPGRARKSRGKHG